MTKRSIQRKINGGFWGRRWFSEDSEGDLRYSYEVIKLPQSGTIFADTTEALKPVEGSSFRLYNKTAPELVKSVQGEASGWKIGFAITWFVLLAIGVGFGIAGIYNHEDY